MGAITHPLAVGELEWLDSRLDKLTAALEFASSPLGEASRVPGYGTQVTGWGPFPLPGERRRLEKSDAYARELLSLPAADKRTPAEIIAEIERLSAWRAAAVDPATAQLTPYEEAFLKFALAALKLQDASALSGAEPSLLASEVTAKLGSISFISHM